jgi:16S rRNA C967 or C1407 C5-methylase (RsmB/RsmF family)
MATGRRAHAADRPAGIRPTDATIPLEMEAPLSMARLGAKVNACGGTPTKRASALSLLRRFFASQGAVLDDSSCESARLAHPEWILCALRGAWPADCEASRSANNEASPMAGSTRGARPRRLSCPVARRRDPRQPRAPCRLGAATCSVLPEENAHRIDAFLGGHRDAHLVPIEGSLGP